MTKIGVLILALVLALTALGVGFAMWSETLTITGNVNTGELDKEFVVGSFMQKDTGLDWTCDTGLVNVRQLDKDVGSCAGEFSDSDGDGDLDTLTVTISNAYPCYYTEISIKEHNNGTIPLIITGAVLTYGGKDYPLPDGKVVTTDDGVFEIRWLNNTGHQLDPCDVLEESWEIHILQPAQENTTYTFIIKVGAVQWNE